MVGGRGVVIRFFLMQSYSVRKFMPVNQFHITDLSPLGHNISFDEPLYVVTI